MKKIKKLLSLVLLGSVIGIGVSQFTTVKASACNVPSHTYVNFGFDDFPGITFSTKMKNQYSGYVYNIQWVLNHIGYDAGSPDGHYGSNTYNAVYNFQADHHLSRDGKVGAQTWYALQTHCK